MFDDDQDATFGTLLGDIVVIGTAFLVLVSFLAGVLLLFES